MIFGLQLISAQIFRKVLVGLRNHLNKQAHVSQFMEEILLTS